MRWSLAACLIAVGLTSAQADELTNPLSLVPKQADVALRVEPGKLVDTVRSLPKLAELAQFPSVREVLDSTNSRRFVKFIQYYEKNSALLGRNCSRSSPAAASSSPRNSTAAAICPFSPSSKAATPNY